MESDYEFKLFSIDLCRNLWFQNNIIGSLPPRPRECKRERDSAYSSIIADAVNCRRRFFNFTLCDKIYRDKETFSKSDSDFYLYLQNKLDDFIAYDCLGIFDKILMTCSVILQMGIFCFTIRRKIRVYSASSCLEMYFQNRWKSQFYEDGGWTGLEKHARCYQSKLLEDGVMFVVCKNEDDMLDAFNLIVYASKNYYDMEKIKAVFLKRKNEIKMLPCAKCVPLFDAFSVLCFKRLKSINKLKVIEGYLQIILRMLSEKQMKDVDEKYHKWKTITFKDDAQLRKEGYCSNQAMNFDSDFCYDKNLLPKPYEKKVLTDVFERQLFENLTSCSDSKQCLFCAQNCEQIPSVKISKKETRTNATVNLDTSLTDETKFSDDTQKLFETEINNEFVEDDNDVDGDLMNQLLSLEIPSETSNVITQLPTNLVSIQSKLECVDQTQVQDIPNKTIVEDTHVTGDLNQLLSLEISSETSNATSQFSTDLVSSQNKLECISQAQAQDIPNKLHCTGEVEEIKTRNTKKKKRNKKN